MAKGEQERHLKTFKGGITRREALKGIGGIAAILATGTAPSLIREAGPSAATAVRTAPMPSWPKSWATGLRRG
jgi:hypothetical protein